MPYSIRSILSNKIGQVLNNGFSIGGKGLRPSSLLPLLKISPTNGPNIEYALNLNKLTNNFAAVGLKQGTSLSEWSSEFITKFQVDSSIVGVYYAEEREKIFLRFIVNKDAAIKEVINLVLRRPKDFWKSSALLTGIPQNIIVEFSSPNIAKPFHLGHLRSTIVGNFVSNLHEALGHRVTRLNYLGDWGLQFGLLKHGLDLKQMSESDLKLDPIKTLYKLYVWINEEASKNPEIEEAAKKIFKQMEEGDVKTIDIWKIIKRVSLDELSKSYSRLNITFDEYHGESMYKAKECHSVLALLEEKGLAKLLKDGRKVYKMTQKENVTLLKSDGAPLYITRDLSAAVERYHQYRFDKMFYVVDSSQQKHFHALFKMLEELGYDFAHRLAHVRFGRVLGMSSRKGTAMFLTDILNEAQERMIHEQAVSDNTKVSGDQAYSVADTVGVSSVVAAILKSSRMRDINFDWNAAIQSKGDTGVRLQYAHCRLASLEEKCPTRLNLDQDWDETLLKEPEAVELVQQIARFDEILQESYEELESVILVNYLFRLCKSINRAWKVLPVKDAPESISESRLKLFRSSKLVLGAGLRILGIVPLDKM